MDKSLWPRARPFIKNTKMKSLMLHFEHEIDAQISYGLLQLLTNRLTWITFKFYLGPIDHGLKTGKKTQLKALRNREGFTSASLSWDSGS